MSDVKEAAERLRRFNRELMQGTVVESGRVDYEGVEAARITLADAYLADHRPDDDVLLDEDWLRSVGAEFNEGELVIKAIVAGRQVQLRFMFDPFDLSRVSSWSLLGSTGDGRIWLPTRSDGTTAWIARGDVRQLAKALGVKLEEAE